MASRAPTTKTTLSPEYKQKTLVLRQKAEDMRTNVEVKLQERVEEFKKKGKDCSDEEIDKLVDDAFKDVEDQVKEQLGKMKEEVKSHAPKKPVKTASKTEEEFKREEEQYQKDRAAYMDYVGYVTGFLKGLTKLFEDICKKIREFFRNLWNWVKQAFKDIAKRVTDFFKYLKDLFSTGIEALFG